MFSQTKHITVWTNLNLYGQIFIYIYVMIFCVVVLLKNIHQLSYI